MTNYLEWWGVITGVILLVIVAVSYLFNPPHALVQTESPRPDVIQRYEDEHAYCYFFFNQWHLTGAISCVRK